MALVVNSNIAAMDAYRNLTVSNNNMQSSLEKLSSGSRINKAADDAAGLVISESLKSQTNGLSVAVRNAQDGISMVQTAEGALNETTALLQRVRDLAVQSSNTGANDASSRSAAAAEVNQDLAEIDRISNSTKFGGKNLLDGSSTSGFTFQVGADASKDASGNYINQVNVKISAVNTTGLGLGTQNVAKTSGAATSTLTNAALSAAGGNLEIHGDRNNVTGTAAAPTTITTGTNDVLKYTVDGGTTQSITLGANSTTATIVSDLQSKLQAGGISDAQVNVVNGKLEISSASHTFTTGGSGDTASAALFGGNTASTHQNANDKLSVAVDGGSPVTLDLSSLDNKVYDGATNTVTSLQGDIQTKIAANSSLSGKVTATMVGGSLTLSSTTTGGLSSVQLGGSAASALGLDTAAHSGNGDDIVSMVANGSADAITRIDSAISSVSSTRANLGAVQNRLEHTINNLSVTQENLTASESRIADTDMASEMTNFTKNQILTQAGTAMLAQANQASQGVLKLLQG